MQRMLGRVGKVCFQGNNPRDDEINHNGASLWGVRSGPSK